MISFNFDEGYKSAYVNAVPILKRRGIKATYFLLTSNIRKPGKMDKDNILELSSYGHEMGSQGRNNVNFSKLSKGEIWDEIVGYVSQLDILVVTLTGGV